MASQLTPLVVAGDSGAGSRTLIGKMIWMCGLQLSQVEELSRNDIKDPAALTAFYEKNDYPLSWYARSGHHFTVQSHGASEVAIWVVDATNADGRSISSKKLASMLSDGTVKPQGRLIIAANKMDLVDWSRETFFEIANAFCSVGRAFGRVSIIPISSATGENLMETPAEARWLRDVSAGHSVDCVDIMEHPLLYVI